MRASLFVCGLLSYYAAVIVASRPDYEAEFGPEARARHDAQDGASSQEKDPNDCQNFGNVGQCAIICSYIEDALVNGQDDTVQFETDLSKLNITSPDSIYTTCDPLSGDIMEYTSSKIIKNVEDLKPSLIARFAPVIPVNTTCGDWEDVGMCMSLCDYIQRPFQWRGVEYYETFLKDYQIVSNHGDTTLCDPDDGNIYDHSNPRQLLASFRELHIVPKNKTTDSDGNRMPIWHNPGARTIVG